MAHAPHPPHRTSRAGVLLVVIGLGFAVLVAVGLIWSREIAFWIKGHTAGSAWFLTYEGAAVGGGPRATDVRYGHNPDRYKSQYAQESTGPVQLPWSTEVFVNVGKEARVEVVPAADGVVSCRILLDGVRVVAEGKSPGPGTPAVCRVDTPSTPEKWPR
ncbi:hypothetical protein [Streptomyces sp. CBMA152]|uniref:hypothetical protein n=1 Tax=Streptomyces sp. CBMA152 TaxID=1896312 RepID=UPI0016611171|nr:hypothetical protein [Streptomyces sp. CBMA152]MBD0742695.1 hypothetical protein [Streptomyces sp. CBMA152]